MKLVCIVQARMTSRRLPGKVLLPLAGRPLLAVVVERVRRASIFEEVLVATSWEPADDPIEQWARRSGTPCVRGPLKDVVARFLHAMDQWPAEGYARICADSPLLDPVIVRAVAERYRKHRCDLATNVFPRTFPKGQSAEVIAPSAFRELAARPLKPGQREHVTHYFYENAHEYRIENVLNEAEGSAVDLSIDTAEQYETLCRLIDARGFDPLVGTWREWAGRVSNAAGTGAR